MRKLITGSFFLFFSFLLKAQYLETGISGGLTSYIGDLQPNKPDSRSFKTSGGVFARWNLSPIFAVKSSLLYARFTASDSYAYGTRRARNLESITTLYEAAVMGELNLTRFDVMDGRGTAPYVSVGMAGFYFNPQAHTEAGLTDLQPLGTEGQLLDGGKGYSRFSFAIPIGVGFKLALGKRANLGFEFGLRYTFTDYLDDVSGNYPNIQELAKQSELAAYLSYRMPQYFNQKLENPQGLPRGDKYKNDLYYYTGFNLSINLASKDKMEFDRTYQEFMRKL